MEKIVLRDEANAYDGDTNGEYRVSIDGVHVNGESVSEAFEGKAVVAVVLKSDAEAVSVFFGGGDAEAYNTIGKAMANIIHRVSTCSVPKINRLAFLMGLTEGAEED